MVNDYPTATISAFCQFGSNKDTIKSINYIFHFNHLLNNSKLSYYSYSQYHQLYIWIYMLKKQTNFSRRENLFNDLYNCKRGKN